jgi:hypothetical protein
VADLGILSPSSLPVVDHSEPWRLGPSPETRPNPDDREELAARALRAWIEGAPLSTRRAYAHGLGWLSHYMRAPTAYHALRTLSEMGPDVGGDLVASWGDWCSSTRGSAERTIRTYRSAIYSGLRIIAKYFDTWIPQPGQIRYPSQNVRTWETLEHLFAGDDWKDARDRAIFSLMVRDRISRKKISAMDCDSFFGEKSKDLILDYLALRPESHEKALFLSEEKENLVNQNLGFSRLSVSGIAKIMQRRTGTRLKPHGIHHFGAMKNG